MAVNNDDFSCKNCGSLLEWIDTIDTEGGIQEGYIIENQVWHCPGCHKDYVIEQKVYFTENDVDIISITET